MFLKEIVNHCPFGCETLDERGYCRHLVGFTNNGKTMEVVVRVRDKQGELTGMVRVQGGRKTEPVLKSDTLVNPEHLQIDKDGIRHNAKEWVSARVYRDMPETEEDLERLTAPAAAS